MHYAAQFRSDGEAMCLAIAEARGWSIATDDRKAIRVARQAGLAVLSCPELIKAWVNATAPDAKLLVQVLTDIQTLRSSGLIQPCPSRRGGTSSYIRPDRKSVFRTRTTMIREWSVARTWSSPSRPPGEGEKALRVTVLVFATSGQTVKMASGDPEQCVVSSWRE